jgi:hypothetical protein
VAVDRIQVRIRDRIRSWILVCTLFVKMIVQETEVWRWLGFRLVFGIGSVVGFLCVHCLLR